MLLSHLSNQDHNDIKTIERYFKYDDVFIRSDQEFITFRPSNMFSIIERVAAIYSRNGKDPNLVDDENWLHIYKPFEKVAENWYISRKLHLRFGTRSPHLFPVPESLFDFSKDFECIDQR